MGLNIDSKDVWDLEILRPFKIKDNFKLFLINVFFLIYMFYSVEQKDVAFVICLQVLIQNALESYNLCLSYHIFKVFYDQKSSPPTVKVQKINKMLYIFPMWPNWLCPRD